jgi:hypothetical protein
VSKRIYAISICQNCGNAYERRRFPSGKLELISQFKKRRFCSHSCAVKKTGQERTLPSFWDGVDKSAGNDACWPWKLAINANGYGSFWHTGKCYTASRYAYELANGPIPFGKGYHGNVVMHSCDNRACCNPRHLRIGTQGDNNRDRDAKGRGWWQKVTA